MKQAFWVIGQSLYQQGRKSFPMASPADPAAVAQPLSRDGQQSSPPGDQVVVGVTRP
jgi:hypothetical protein